MYGTPLDESARNLKIEIQKALILHLRKKGTENAKQQKYNNITFNALRDIVNSISKYKKEKNGNFLYQYGSGYITISKLDFKQYSSVSYATVTIVVRSFLFFC